MEADDPDTRPGSMRESAPSRQDSVEAKTAAAIEIQRVFRGYLTRWNDKFITFLCAAV